MAIFALSLPGYSFPVAAAPAAEAGNPPSGLPGGRVPGLDVFNNPDMALDLRGGEIKAGGLRLVGRQHAEVQIKTKMTGAAGSLSLWIKPLWDAGDSQSHVVFSMPWSDGKSGYMALSWGWWEPTHAGRLMFIVNNQESLACSAETKLDSHDWNHIVAAWDNGHQPGCKLFVDGHKLAQHDLAYRGDYAASGRAYIGSDAGSTELRGRGSDFELLDFKIHPARLSEQAVFDLYRRESRRFPGLAARKEAWLDAPGPASGKPAATPKGVPMENRVIFDETAEWATSELYANRLLARIKQAGFNVLVPCVWHGRGGHYPSRVADMDPAVKARVKPGRDPLAELIQKAHALGIEVHPWFTVMRREDDRLPAYFGAGTPPGAYDVHNVEFRNHMIEVMLDVVRRYGVDGVNLDYIRAMGVCQSEACRKDYAQKTGHDLAADSRAALPGSEAFARIAAWQTAAVSDLVGRFASQARKLRPNLVISVDGHPAPGKPSLEGRDEFAWAERGWVDAVFNMDYRPKPDVAAISATMRALEGKASVVQVFSNYDRWGAKIIPRPGRTVAGYANYARNHWGRNGLAYYMAVGLSDEQILALGSGPFKEPAVTAWSHPLKNQ